MKVAGIIAEFNPFHSGHKYLIDQAKKVTGADYVCIVMSGDFVQNGKPAFAAKQLRTKMALLSGADAVFMLPVSVSTQSAKGFAYGAVRLLSSLGCIDYLCFGSENADINILSEVAGIAANEPDLLKLKIKQLTSEGIDYPTARACAIADCMVSYNRDELFTLLSSPNNILAIEYINAINSIKDCRIKPVPIKRIGSGFLDDKLSFSEENCFCSATAIRKAFTDMEEDVFESISRFVPEGIHDMYKENYNRLFPVYPDQTVSWFYHRIINESKEALTDICDCDEFLANRILKSCKRTYFSRYEELVHGLLAKNYTYNRISRVLCHYLLSFTKEQDVKELLYDRCLYARLLGFKMDSLPLLSLIKSSSSVPVISKSANAQNILSNHYDNKAVCDCALTMYSRDILAANQYQLMLCEGLRAEYKTDEQQPISII